MKGHHNPGVKHKSCFGCTPKKGTLLRNVAILLLRGTNTRELRKLYGPQYTDCLRVLRDEKGYDIKKFPLGGLQIVGKMKWDGSYRSFIEGKIP